MKYNPKYMAAARRRQERARTKAVLRKEILSRLIKEIAAGVVRREDYMREVLGKHPMAGDSL